MDVAVRDETATGAEMARILLADVPSPVTLRTLIVLRVREEVARYNARPDHHFRGLVQPTGAEIELNGYRLSAPRTLSWEKQADVALAAFERNGFFVFVRDRQVVELDEELLLADAEVVSFVRLVPLVGG